MAADTDRFVVEANIERFRNLLSTPLAPATRETLRALLAEAEEDLRRLNRPRRSASWHGFVAAFACVAATVAQAA